MGEGPLAGLVAGFICQERMSAAAGLLHWTPGKFEFWRFPPTEKVVQ